MGISLGKFGFWDV